MIKIGILDDEAIICETITKYLLELGYDVLDYALNFEEGLALIQNNKPDIMLLDVNIGGVKSGIDLAQLIRENYQIPLIFISSYSDSNTLSRAKLVKPNGYLVKPFSKEDLFTSIEIALSNFSASINGANENNSSKEYKLVKDAFFIKQGDLYVKIYFKDINYVKSAGVYAEIYTSQKIYLIRESLKNLQTSLPESEFFQIHRSYLVNVNSIDAVNSECIVIQNEILPLSRNMKEAFLLKLNLM